ncbi:carbohydrate ABC transporter permease [Salinisphaera sp. USBA-960]|nr:carbohydrate ABC transporter permease [Salifodinibacter halophilus]NNC26412.1 carbohydrate ABC transporter permease [Salifodinibacter halophilus]
MSWPAKLGLNALAWLVCILMFFPVFWLILTSFKTNALAAAEDPVFVFWPTIAGYVNAIFDNNYLHYLLNSGITAIGSTLICMLLAIPAAYSMVFRRSKYTDSTLLWMLSTKMLPPVGVLLPIYVVYKNIHLLDSALGLVFIYAAMNLPIVVWLLYTYFKDVPAAILEAAEIDGASLFTTLSRIVVPLSLPGILSTGLLAIVLAWNESFWAINLTNVHGATLAVFVSDFKSARGQFWASMSAASTLSVLPILVAGWFTQRQLVRGLTFGAVK